METMLDLASLHQTAGPRSIVLNRLQTRYGAVAIPNTLDRRSDTTLASPRSNHGSITNAGPQRIAIRRNRAMKQRWRTSCFKLGQESSCTSLFGPGRDKISPRFVAQIPLIWGLLALHSEIYLPPSNSASLLGAVP